MFNNSNINTLNFQTTLFVFYQTRVIAKDWRTPEEESLVREREFHYAQLAFASLSVFIKERLEQKKIPSNKNDMRDNNLIATKNLLREVA